ncbi:MAG: UDP-2,3-diacylglucosamine hydrolase [Flavobacteriales bacterium TMED123]|nr:MAG: UDP-2,3-diacylglucosamine hydrolase [Flavobacteriales bacterium TMED123]|tara:strand:+ start:1304 stop:2050 length:747 start_codon:yes stop_codon:yes gene_type:complete
MPRTKLYFASDFHLGVPTHAKSLEREKRIIAWLDSIKEDAKSIYLLGDIFDFWFEYKTVVPKGYVRILAKLAKLVDDGIKINIIKGNHDLWMYDYFPKEIGVNILEDKTILKENGKQIFLAHGDGLGPGDLGYKLIKKVFESSICQWLFARLHPNFGIGIAQFWSKKSRIGNQEKPDPFLGEEKEWLVSYCKRKKNEINIDYFVFGHRHLPLEITIDEKTKYINIGDWIHHNSYAVFDEGELTLQYFK